VSGALELETPLLVGEGEILFQFARKKNNGPEHLIVAIYQLLSRKFMMLFWQNKMYFCEIKISLNFGVHFLPTA
jgi:hypothetical protein